ncbi:hypothetical protein B4U79_03836 [Dinothrombium tinctorium]|uniref:Vitellogenin domain-containing protein n=1 Tax=Dinothrombium tinctorium TaxID=1965070 RepID=A0A443QZW6_9ACAR|nr:hypothetical protein B4U79_03836 [Dinothrombium tinctorium]
MLLCHGLQNGVRYHYKYSTSIILNNNDHMGKEPVGFSYEGNFVVENVWENENNYLIKVNFDSSESGRIIDRKGETKGSLDSSNELDNELALYAHIVDHKNSEEVNAFYAHKKDSITKTNLKKAIVFLLRTKKPKEIPSLVWSKSGQDLKKYFYYSNIGNPFEKTALIPEIVDEWETKSKLGRDHAIVLESSGWQNLSLISQLYPNAHSKLHSTFSLKLTKEEQAGAKSSFSTMKSVESVIEAVGNDYIFEKPKLFEEKKTCHNCMTLANIVNEYEDFLKEDKIASIPAAIAYLKLVERIRSGGPGASKSDIIEILKKCKKSQKESALASFLDILAGAMTEQSIDAALEFLNLPSNEDLDISERFLATLAAAFVTLSQKDEKSSDSSHDFVVKELIRVSTSSKWSSQKLKWSTLITLGTILRSHNSITSEQHDFDDDLNRDVLKHLISELRSCVDSDCRVSLLYAIGNAGNLKLSLNTLEKYSLNLKEKRESVAAIRALKECLNYNKSMDNKLINKVKSIAAKVVFDAKHETTSRIIASEIIAHYLNDDILINSLLFDVANFDNFEMTTMIWTKALKALRKEKPVTVNNWLLHSTIFNGTSSSFKRAMGETKTMNVTYGITMELLNRGKLLKESSFDVEIQGHKSKSQHLLSVNLFARGLESFAGGDSLSSVGDSESTSAGMSLKVFDVQLRPYTFFTGTGELMGHVWSGTASDPTTAFRGNLLVSDISHGYPLINGFIVDHSVRGVISLDLSGEIRISLWNRNSNSVVRTKGALLVQGSQSIRTSEPNLAISQQFSFGGESSIDFVTDIDFYTSPFKMCMQIIQPQFLVRHNTRKYERVNSLKTGRRIHRRNYVIPAKSFALNRDNNEMCSIMQH